MRRIALSANHVACEGAEQKVQEYEQLDLFTDYGTQLEQKKKEAEELAREKRMQQAVLEIKKKFGKNAVLKGMNLEEGATAVKRNSQIGGHRHECAGDISEISSIFHIRRRSRHTRMPVRDRAAQFAPFAALTGFRRSLRGDGTDHRKADRAG